MIDGLLQSFAHAILGGAFKTFFYKIIPCESSTFDEELGGYFYFKLGVHVP